MASTTAGETLREMVQGFNAMQAQLGLLPPQTGQMPMGVGLNQPPPMPPTMHPGAISQHSHDVQMAAMQRTMQAAQATRYMPPPSSPGGGTFNPYVAHAMHGGGGMMPSPMYNTPSNYGMYRPDGARAHAPHSTVFNPYVTPAFSSPMAHTNAGIYQQQSRASSNLLGATQTGFELGGALLGGTLGSAFGPVGGFVGSYLGGKAGGFLGGMATNPIGNDLAMGRHLQNVLSPSMVSGASLNMLTGQGPDRQSGIQTAIGLRGITRDHDFVRQTGFNNADISKLTNLAADHGFLDTARNPDDIARKMKDIAKSIKMMVQITHDPDVRNAMQDLSKMRQLGFEGLPGQLGAVANRSMFSRMSGMSQSALDAHYGMPGAMAAQGQGLAGSTGYGMGMASAGIANVAINSGSFSNLQLARAGGRQGVAQTNLMASLGAANQDLYMAAALKKSANGSIDIDTDAYSRVQGMDINAVARMAANNMNAVGVKGISELSTRKQEFKDRLSASQSPIQQQLNIARQAMAMQKETGLSFGGALNVMIGSTQEGQYMSADQREQSARTLELQFSNQEFYRGMRQQLRVESRNMMDRNRAARAQYRTPGLFTKMGQGITDLGYGASDAITSPFRRASQYLDETSENNALMFRGEHMVHHDDITISHNAEERRRMMAAGDNPSLAGGGGQSGSLLMNQIGFGLGLTTMNDPNIRSRIAAMSRGDLLRYSFRSQASDSAASGGAVKSAHAIARARDMSASDSVSLMGGLQQRGSQAIGSKFNASDFVRRLAVRVDGKIQKASITSDPGAMLPSHTSEAAKEEIAGLSPSEQAAALKFLESNGDSLHTAVAQNLLRYGGQKTQEVIGKTMELASLTGALTGNLSKDRIEKIVNENLVKLTDDHVSDSFKTLLSNQDAESIAYASLQTAALNGGSKSALNALTEFEKKYANDPQALERIKSNASSIAKSADKKTSKALTYLGSKNSADLTKEISESQSLVSSGKFRTSYESELTKLSDKIPMLRGMEGGSGSDVLDSLATKATDEDLKKLTPAQRKMLDRYKQGDAKQKGSVAKEFMASLAGNATTERSELVGMQSHEAGMGKLEADQASLAEMSSKLASGDLPQKVFAEAVDTFAEAAKTLKQAADQQAMNARDPARRN